MSAPFRDDREALLARAAALEEENEALRAEVAELSPGRVVAPGARLSRDALDRLDRMRRDIELVPEEHAAAARPHPPGPAHDGAASVPKPRALAGPEPAAPQLAALGREVYELRRGRARFRLWLAIVFAIGAAVGALLARHA